MLAVKKRKINYQIKYHDTILIYNDNLFFAYALTQQQVKQDNDEAMKIKSLLGMQQAFLIIFIASNDKDTKNSSLASH